MPDRAGPRRAFTLIEMLVAIAIVGILIALLVPAVQSAREAARRTECVNHLKQAGLALAAFEGSRGAYPPGYVSGVSAAGDDTGPGWGWAVPVLPMLEQTTLLNAVNMSIAVEAPENETARIVNIGVFLCPSDTVKPEWWAYKRTLGGKPIERICRVAPSNYVGVFGTSEPGVDGDGMFFRNSRIAVRDITDGTSQTLMLGERSHSLGEATWAGAVTGAVLYPDDNDGIGKFETENASGMVLGHTGERHGPGDRRSDVNQFYSLHAGQGANFLFADGHVGFLKATMNYAAYKALATRAGGDIVSDSY